MEDDYTWRDLEGGEPEYFSADKPNPPLRHDSPITTRLEGPWGLPWLEGFENPDAPTGLYASSPNPQIDQPDVGGVIPPGDFEGAFRTRGPVQAWGHEVSGGLWGNQAIGRTMRFPINIPDRYDANGVWVGDYRDQLASTLIANGQEAFTPIDSVEDLITWVPPTFAGYGS